ncbi:MAG: glycosyltransferase family 4 protein [Bacteroidetes bacterium]|nr:glycosyltransferase family 4 protein [Bacteroidota bacterium]
MKKEPIGGFKIVYEYANMLSENGIQVNLIHPADLPERKGIYFFIRNKLKYFYRLISNSHTPGNWFKFAQNVKLKWVPLLKEKYLPDADINIATAWRTAIALNEMKLESSKKFYFLQSLETWNGPETEVVDTWRFPFKKIVIAKWLLRFAEKIGEKAVYIPNGFDFNNFYVINEPEKRDKYSMLMLYHELELKGSRFGIEAVSKLKKKFPEIKFTLFGVQRRPDNLPEWFDYVQTPSIEKLRSIYNSASIFISPSLIEGFPLPPAEAMACGCTLVASDIDGHKEYNIENETCLFFKAGDAQSLYENLEKLLLKNDLRIALSKKGTEYIHEFSWDKSIKMFLSELKN